MRAGSPSGEPGRILTHGEVGHHDAIHANGPHPRSRCHATHRGRGASGAGTRVEEVQRWAEHGCDELVVTPPGLVNSDEGLYALVQEIREAAIEFPRAGWRPRSGEPRARHRAADAG